MVTYGLRKDDGEFFIEDKKNDLIKKIAELSDAERESCVREAWTWTHDNCGEQFLTLVSMDGVFGGWEKLMNAVLGVMPYHSMDDEKVIYTGHILCDGRKKEE